ncbi:MAG TPA: hypothetical protein VM553_05410 [Dongiaceae bacterium]|nr:hypothetical protein [Dongiaceae bacterium]
MIGADYKGYRNHVARMVAFSLMLRPCTAEEQRKIEIAACYHDIGIWAANTMDYLPPSLPPAREHLAVNALQDWTLEIEQMILLHHKIRPVRNGLSPLVELFRQADLVDFSLGLLKHGLPATQVNAVKATFPNAGFHKCLMRRAGPWLLQHPLNPVPMMKW